MDLYQGEEVVTIASLFLSFAPHTFANGEGGKGSAKERLCT
jgi:hypothetical protein